MTDRGACRIDDCERPIYAKQLCSRHYQNWSKYGGAVPRKDRPLAERISEIGWTVTPTGCWEWNGKRNDNGYGIFDALRLGFTHARAHRVVYQHLFGNALEESQQLRHRCDNPPCVNPEHLLPGTALDNSRDMVERRRHWRHNQTRCGAGHDLTSPGATRPYKGRHASCVECIRLRAKRDNDRRREKKAAWYQASKQRSTAVTVLS